MSIERLRECIIILCDINVKLNSSTLSPRVAIEQAVTKMLVTFKGR